MNELYIGKGEIILSLFKCNMIIDVEKFKRIIKYSWNYSMYFTWSQNTRSNLQKSIVLLYVTWEI